MTSRPPFGYPENCYGCGTRLGVPNVGYENADLTFIFGLEAILVRCRHCSWVTQVQPYGYVEPKPDPIEEVLRPITTALND
jgi:hypothetical protein